MISILTPSRGRPEMLKRMMDSAPDAEHLVWVDDDDESDYSFVKHFNGPRQRLGIIWNFLARLAIGDYLMMGNDDLIFRDENWQERLEETLSPNEIGVACFNDGINSENHFAFPIVTRKWYQALGYFTPEIFNFGYHDTWIFDVAKRAGCTHYISDVLVEHMHPTAGKRPVDQTFRERNWANDPQIFAASTEIREKHAFEVRRAIEDEACCGV